MREKAGVLAEVRRREFYENQRLNVSAQSSETSREETHAVLVANPLRATVLN